MTPTEAPHRRRARSPLPGMITVVALVALAGIWGIVRAADARVADVDRIDELDGVLADAPIGSVSAGVDLDGDGVIDEGTATYPAINFLLVGSDSREGVEAGDEDFGVIGSTSDVGGRRSDTIMVLRQEQNGGAALMSIPRDLWVPISGTGRSQRINSAYNEGPERLAATVTDALGIPIHHYVEVDFVGFRDIIEKIGGVELCVGYPARDVATGLTLEQGCQILDGTMALAYARSRKYQEWDGTNWVSDPRADLGRIERQQLFMRAAVDGSLRKLQSSPFGSGDLIGEVAESVRIDSRLDPYEAAQTLRQAMQVGLRTFALPVYSTTISGNSVLDLAEGSDAVLDYFRGVGAVPVEFETTNTNSDG